MTIRAGHWIRICAFAIGIMIAPSGLIGVGAAAATPTDFGNGCTMHPDNAAATVDSLRFRCAWDQQDAIYRAAPLGAIPHGVKNGWVARPPIATAVAPALWIGKTFYTGSNGGYVENRLTGSGIEGWRADVYPAPSRVDGRPAWVLNYIPSPTPPLYDEIREISPGVWFGYSWWRGIFQTPQLLAFVLA